MNNKIPNHIGLIVDGNRRWAKARNLHTLKGHEEGFNVLKKIIKKCFNEGVTYVSAYIFSTENWNRSDEEVSYLMKLFERYFSKEIQDLHKNNIKVLSSGDRKNKVSKKLVEIINKAEELTSGNSGGTLCLCFNYGGQTEIIEATRKIAQKVQSGELLIDDIDSKLFEQNLYTPEVPAVDLMIRTSGEQRISNFQLWRMAYSEMLFLDKPWPDMKDEDIEKALLNYQKRDRRMGGDSKK